MTTPIQTQISCWAAQYNIHIGINTCESTPSGNYNTEIVFGPTGNYVASYRKMHPFFPSCFLTPPTPQLITFNAPVLDNKVFGIFTCYDILFAAPAPELVAEGVHDFVYSAAIPVIGNEAQVLWSDSYQSTLLASNLQDGQSGIYINGTRVTPEPASGQDVVMVAIVG
jgi:predicted amidohydrolase